MVSAIIYATIFYENCVLHGLGEVRLENCVMMDRGKFLQVFDGHAPEVVDDDLLKSFQEESASEYNYSGWAWDNRDSWPIFNNNLD